MTATRQTLKQYFRQYATPTEAQFAELIDAFVHKDEDSLTQSKIDGLVAALEGKVSTSQVNTLVASKVSEIVSDPNFAAAPTAHSHVAADVEGLAAFITRVTNFLDSADVSDTTINRWKEIETFLTGITDQQTLTGLLLQLKNEITALIPAPAPTNYLKQISDLDAYTDAQEGEIVQYVGSTTAKYTRGFCYEKVPSPGFPTPNYIVSETNAGELQAGDIYVETGEESLSVYMIQLINGGRAVVIGEPAIGGKLYASYYTGEQLDFDITNVSSDFGKYYVTAGGREFEFQRNQDKLTVVSSVNYADNEDKIFIIESNESGVFSSWVYCPLLGRATYVSFSGSMPAQGALAWTPIVTSPSVS